MSAAAAAAAFVLSVVDEFAAEPMRLLRPEEEDGVLLERSMVSRSRFVVRVFLYLVQRRHYRKYWINRMSDQSEWY